MEGMAEAAATAPVTLTPRALERLALVLESEKRSGRFVRVQVQGGGCSGFSYGFSLDGELDGKEDVVAAPAPDGGPGLVVDSTSLAYLAGSEIDWTESPGGSMFTIANPNATSSCGCGTSFAIG